MGFSEQDFAELQLRLHGLLNGGARFGPRIMPRPPIPIPGLPDLGKSKRPPAKDRRKKPPPDPGYERFQERLPGF